MRHQVQANKLRSLLDLATLGRLPPLVSEIHRDLFGLVQPALAAMRLKFRLREIRTHVLKLLQRP